MTPWFYSRTKRNTALLVLWVWLFALASGVANACLIQANEMRGHGPLVEHSSAAEKGHVISVAHIGTISEYGIGLEESKSQCIKVCDDGSQSLPKKQGDLDLTYPVLALPPTVTWANATGMASALGLVAFQPHPLPGLPIRVRLSRLAL